jgi:hypothetical protein
MQVLIGMTTQAARPATPKGRYGWIAIGARIVIYDAVAAECLSEAVDAATMDRIEVCTPDAWSHRPWCSDPPTGSRLSGPSLLTSWLGNPSLSGVKSGFPTITESPLDRDYFPHGYVLGRTATQFADR